MDGQLSRLIAGCMTGTSMDAIDVALVEMHHAGLALRPRFIGMVSMDLGSLRDDLTALAGGTPQPALRYMRAARMLGELHVQAVTQLCVEHLPADGRLEMIVAHGQTIWHAPDESLSWQLMDPWPMVRQLRVPVLFDLRQADLIARGQGAPITPLADWVMYRDQLQHRLVVNLGGICNVTDLPADGSPAQVTGGDIGPCNLLIDGLVKLLYPGRTFDEDGRIAASGKARPQFTAWVRQSSFFSRPVPHSTGREDFNADWLRGLLDRTGNSWPAQDVIASAVDAVADIITQHSRSQPGQRHVILAGGGGRNRTLVERIRQKLDSHDRLSLSDDLGIPIEAREAVAFAVLGALSQDRVPITLPAITGAVNPGRAGVWAYP